ncbi:hypothetical protein [Undibacterium crateris]|uniref:hypothetical protein n=1 Tax=Undibacterium crateris TaxID=2528175 RepID=UPI0013897A16|nr:hypothetical protein [Undibacterium crateris]NDI85245.1 hypothetical protein [Undibacterium crateris]
MKQEAFVSGLILFGLSLLVLLLFAWAHVRHSRRLMNYAFAAMVATSLVGWYTFIFPEGLQPLFFIGTLLTVAAISFFFYAVYTYDTVLDKVTE